MSWISESFKKASVQGLLVSCAGNKRVHQRPSPLAELVRISNSSRLDSTGFLRKGIFFLKNSGEIRFEVKSPGPGASTGAFVAALLVL